MTHQTSENNKSSKKMNQSLFWKIEKEGIPTSYLFGTIHVPISKFAPEQSKEFLNSKVLITEVGMSSTEIILADDMHTNRFQRQMQKMILTEALSSLKKDPISSSREERAQKREARRETNDLQECSLILESGSILDDRIIAAKKSHQKHIGLETMAAQLSYGKTFLGKASLLEMLISYKNQDLNRIKNICQGFLFDPFVKQRNLNWLKKLPSLLKKQSCFIAVGVSHLLGETGLIDLLRNKGYAVSAIPCPTIQTSQQKTIKQSKLKEKNAFRETLTFLRPRYRTVNQADSFMSIFKTETQATVSKRRKLK